MRCLVIFIGGTDLRVTVWNGRALFFIHMAAEYGGCILTCLLFFRRLLLLFLWGGGWLLFLFALLLLGLILLTNIICCQCRMLPRLLLFVQRLSDLV